MGDTPAGVRSLAGGGCVGFIEYGELFLAQVVVLELRGVGRLPGSLSREFVMWRRACCCISISR